MLTDAEHDLPEENVGLLYIPFERLTDEQRISKIWTTFQRALLAELRRILEMDVPAPVAAAVLSCCAIDLLGSLHSGRQANGATFQRFVEDFMPSEYDPRKLNRLRDSVVHTYATPRGGYHFSVGRTFAGDHLRAGLGTFLVLDVLVDDIATAGAKLFRKAGSDLTIRSNILKRTRKPGLLSMFQFLPDQRGLPWL